MRPSDDCVAQPSQAKGEATVLADVGGTNVRFAVLADGVLGQVEHRHDSDFATFADAIGHFISHSAKGIKVTAAELAVAGVVHGERCALTNSPWIIDGAELRAKFGLTRIGLVNDFAAIAHALPYLGDADLFPLGSGKHAVVGAPMAVLGPGTGLGVAALVPHGGEMIAIASEGGHATLPAASRRKSLVIAHLRRQFGHVSAERALSGAGLVSLYRAISALSRAPAPPRTAAEITQAALAGDCPTSKAALDMFCALLGTVAGNVALSYGARGGVFIAGGILPQLSDYVAHSQFRERFEGKGRLQSYLEPIPVYVILNTDAAFLGLQSLAASLSAGPRSPAPPEAGEIASTGRPMLSGGPMAGRSVTTRLPEDRKSAKR